MKTPSQIRKELSNELVHYYSNAINSYNLLSSIIDFTVSGDSLDQMSDEIAMTQRDFESLAEDRPDSEFFELYDKTADIVVCILITEMLSILRNYFNDNRTGLLNISKLENTAGIPAKTLYHFLKGERSLNEDHLNKLLPVLNDLKL
jgi:predicted transcriptional regulator